MEAHVVVPRHDVHSLLSFFYREQRVEPAEEILVPYEEIYDLFT